MTNDSKKVKKRTFLFFPESCFLIFWFWVDFYDLWWCVSFMCDCLWLRRFDDLWKVTYFSSWFRKLARYGWWNSTLCPNDLDVVPMTWMLSQWLGCCPNDLDVVPGGAISRTVAVAALNVSTSKFDADLLFADMFKRGKKKHPNTFRRKNLEGIFLVQGMEIPILAYMSSPKHHVSHMYLKLYLHDAVYIIYARTNRKHVICPVYESAFNVWS